MKTSSHPVNTPRPARTAQLAANKLNRWASRYEESDLQNVFYGPLHHEVLRMANHAMPHPLTILDVGCGTARLLRLAAQRFPAADLLGLDSAERMLARGRAVAGHGSRIRFVQARAEHLPFPSGMFDLILCTASCHHFDDPDAAFSEIRRVMRQHGVFVLAHLLGATGWDTPHRQHVSTRRRTRNQAAPLTQLLGRARFTTIEAIIAAPCPIMPTTVVMAAHPTPNRAL